jgi:hypothetical protein
VTQAWGGQPGSSRLLWVPPPDADAGEAEQLQPLVSELLAGLGSGSRNAGLRGPSAAAALPLWSGGAPRTVAAVAPLLRGRSGVVQPAICRYESLVGPLLHPGYLRKQSMRVWGDRTTGEI